MDIKRIIYITIYLQGIQLLNNLIYSAANMSQFQVYDEQKSSDHIQDQQNIGQKGEFKCKCGRSYKSYPATYTHIKNKHGGSRQFLQSIIRPNYRKTAKGRPKKFHFQVGVEQMKIQVLQKGIYQLFKILPKDQDIKFLLNFDEQYSQKEVDKVYRNLTPSCLTTQTGILNPESKLDTYGTKLKRFYEEFSKHSGPEISARILCTVNYFFMKNQVDILDEISIGPKDLQQMWYNIQGVDQLIYRIFKEWDKIIQYNN